MTAVSAPSVSANCTSAPRGQRLPRTPIRVYSKTTPVRRPYFQIEVTWYGYERLFLLLGLDSAACRSNEIYIVAATNFPRAPFYNEPVNSSIARSIRRRISDRAA